MNPFPYIRDSRKPLVEFFDVTKCPKCRGKSLTKTCKDCGYAWHSTCADTPVSKEKT